MPATSTVAVNDAHAATAGVRHDATTGAHIGADHRRGHRVGVLRERRPETTSLRAAVTGAVGGQPHRRWARAATTAERAPRVDDTTGSSGPWRQPVPGPHLPGVITGVTLLLGVWLLIAPALLGYGNPGGGFGPRWNDLLLGVLITAVAAARLTRRARLAPLTLASIGLGTWLVIAPFVLAYGFGPNSALVTANDMLVGFTVAMLASFGYIAARMGASDSRL